MASKTTADKAEKPKSAPRKRPTPVKPETSVSGGNGSAVKQNNIATAMFEVPAEAFTVEAYDDPGPKRAPFFCQNHQRAGDSRFDRAAKSVVQVVHQRRSQRSVRIDLADQGFHR